MAKTSMILKILVASSAAGAHAFSLSPSARPTSISTSTKLHAQKSSDLRDDIGKTMIAAALSLSLFLGPAPALADGQTKTFKLPPIDFNDKTRCTLSSSKIGQANAARDKLYDLRQCELSGQDASGFDLSGVIMTKTNLSKAKFVESQFSKAYLHDSNFDGADFSNGIIDRASFTGSSLKGTVFTNAVLTGTSFDGADVENADFTDAYIGSFDIRNLCKNPTLKGENPTTGIDTRLSAGCLD
mmetsp:Transcript_10045/g.11739  ORF Transcript_10045/g.11739 Transcript_10045/m.11739 type:complete len:242 (-) Transcript_10045:84-809(-)|eukprot:CAMPEP_0198264090 /NCGR_PEP_ID=MMETSP1447-20131203/14802_1 /TAXON_ID=420782 /ORGANISM="Chaetoceros dichaeta, Strain CCMP1751" /LENGTH=241 /DNA_ID=CAMNT_0043952927 /DNA_START=84 /DNA_END=809 /DNA_ORIENTATION=+